MEYNEYFLNCEISFTAKGLLALVLAIPADRKIGVRDLSDFTSGRQAVLENARLELLKHGCDIWEVRKQMRSLAYACDAGGRPRATAGDRAGLEGDNIIYNNNSIQEINNINNNPLPTPPYNPSMNTSKAFPDDIETVIKVAGDRAYCMSIEEAARFLDDMKSANWEIDGRPVTNWRKLLDYRKARQSPAQLRMAVVEHDRRKTGLTPAAAGVLPEYEFYTDKQNIKWQRPFGDESAPWELAPDGMKQACI